MSRIKEERLLGEGDNGQDLIRYTDTISGETVKEVSVRPVAEEEKTRKTHKPREVIANKPLMSAEEMTILALKAQDDTASKEVRELIRNMLDTAEEQVLSGSYCKFLHKDEVPSAVVKNIISTLKGLGYKVKRTVNEDGTDIKISWSIKKTVTKEKTSTGRKKHSKEKTEPETKKLEHALPQTFEFEKTKT